MSGSGLRWQEDADEPGFCLLYRGAELAGEVYPRGDGFRWHCKLSDWRQLEPDLGSARDALFARVTAEIVRTEGTPTDTADPSAAWDAHLASEADMPEKPLGVMDEQELTKYNRSRGRPDV